jgi:alanine racemase
VRPVLPSAWSPAEIVRRIGGYASWIEIDLDAIGRNLATIRQRAGVEVMPCVKNDAYGHGLIPVAEYLARQGVRHFLVARLREAEAILDAGIPGRVLNMGPLFAEAQYESVVRRGVVQTVYTRAVAEKLSETSVRLDRPVSVFAKVDTGLRRLGVWHEEAADFVESVAKLPHVRLDGMFSTFTQNPEFDRVQLERFFRLEQALRARGIEPGLRSMASSDAILHHPPAHLDLVRPGALLFGLYPERKDLGAGIELDQALALKARIEHVKWVRRGDSVTYWGRFVAPEPMRIGTLPVGFSDGIPREMANRARVLVAGQYRSSLGSVSLNHLLVDLTGTAAEPGDAVEVIGRHGENTLGRIAETAGWMVYSLVNHLAPDTPRVYYEGGVPVRLRE